METMEKYSIADLAKCYTKPFGGIYVWGVKDGEEYFPLYVGRAKNIPKRIFEHLGEFAKDEKYTTPSWQDIINPKRDLSQARYNNDNVKRIKKPDVIEKVLDNFFCYWKKIPDYPLHQIEESNLANAIGRERLISSGYSQQGVTIPDFIKEFSFLFKTI
ncbi:MAG TPA: GIY-YIG nuclease family protein [Bacteroidia bacterium]